jgi:hypothetical protein
VLLPVLLVAGIWLGGHPAWLPGFARDVLVDDSDAQVYEEALDVIARDYYRPVDRRKLLNPVARRGRALARRPVLGPTSLRATTTPSRSPRTAASRGSA